MSHIVEIHTQVRDPVAIRVACERLGLPSPEEGTFQLFSSQATGLAIRLAGWKYPAVCETETGAVRYDNFSGRWGDPKEFDRFLQAYAVEMTRLQCRKRGHSVIEKLLADGSVKLTVQVGGAA
jgi:hypothetical protein